VVQATELTIHVCRLSVYQCTVIAGLCSSVLGDASDENAVESLLRDVYQGRFSLTREQHLPTSPIAAARRHLHCTTDGEPVLNSPAVHRSAGSALNTSGTRTRAS